MQNNSNNTDTYHLERIFSGKVAKSKHPGINIRNKAKWHFVSIVLMLAVMLGFSQYSFGQILAWDFTSNAGTETTVNSTTTNTNLNASVISKGPGLSNPSGANAFTGSFGAIGYSTGTTTLATAITAQEYLQFTISVKAGFKVSLSTLNANFLRSTNNAPNSFQWQYSLDAFGTAGVNIGSTISYTLYTTGTASNGTAQTQINLSSISALQNVVNGTNITIRIYGWGAANTGSTFALGKLSGNDLAIGGTVISAYVAPAVTLQPLNQTVCQGTGVSFTAAASGDPVPSVQWQRNTINISGATSTTFTIPTPTTSDNGSYRAVFTNPGGSVTSNAAALSVNAPLASVANQTNITCYTGNNGTITVSASGGTTPYNFSVDNGTNWLPATGTDLRLFTGLLPNTPYRIRVRDNIGCTSMIIQ